MTETRLFPEGTVPEYATSGWYEPRDRARHLEEDGHRPRLLIAAQCVEDLISFGLDTVVDLGAGDGGLLSLLPASVRAWGYDLTPSNVAGAQERGVHVEHRDFLHDDIEWADIAVCTEVLEHLVDPHAFVRKIGQHCKALVASSPCNETVEDHYEFHTWAWDVDGYAAMIRDAGFEIAAHDTLGSCQIVVAVKS